jgi:hypothetical protein
VRVKECFRGKKRFGKKKPVMPHRLLFVRNKQLKLVLEVGAAFVDLLFRTSAAGTKAACLSLAAKHHRRQPKAWLFV